jgi:hypothetical protein
LPGGRLSFHERIATSSTPSNPFAASPELFPVHNQRRMMPISEPSACQDPKAPIGVAQPSPRMPPLQHNQLLPQTKVSAISSAFGLKMATMAKTSNRNT